MINIHDIPKPTFHLFRFFSQLGTKVLDRTPHSLFTRRDDDHIAGVIWNPNDSRRASQKARYHLELPHDGRTYVARTLLIDEAHANPYRAWELMGRERNPSRAQVELLREAARPACRYHALEKVGDRLCLDVELEKNGVQFIDLIPATDHSPEYHELDQAFYDNVSIASDLISQRPKLAGTEKT